MRRPISDNSPVVLKIGSFSLAAPSGGVDTEAIHKVVDQVEALWRLGAPTALVTSGAVAAGLPALGLIERPADIPGLQVAAAVVFSGEGGSSPANRRSVFGCVTPRMIPMSGDKEG